MKLAKKLSKDGLKKNKEIYTPYRMTLIGFVFVFNSMANFLLDKQLDDFYAVSTIKTMLFLGLFIVAVFSLLFFIDVDRDILIRRSKELGLYSVLGLNKKQIGQIFTQELIRVWGSSLLIGIALSDLLYNLMEGGFLQSMGADSAPSFIPNLQANLITVIVFACFSLIMVLLRRMHIRKINPMELFQEEKKKDKLRLPAIFMGLVGAILIAMGYRISLRTISPLAALNNLFTAILLVVVGTSIGFQGISQMIIKALKKNKRRYYKAENFTAWSGLEQRLQTNASGLAAVCILSCATLTLFFLSFSLHFGVRDLVAKTMPREISLSFEASKGEDGHYRYIDKVQQFLKETDLSVERPLEYTMLIKAGQEDKRGTIDLADLQSPRLSDIHVYLLDIHDFPEYQGIHLQPGQAAYFTGRSDSYQQIRYQEEPIQLVQRLDQFDFELTVSHVSMALPVYVFIDDLDVYLAKEKPKSVVSYYYYFDSQDSPEKINAEFENKLNITTSSKKEMTEEFDAIYGGAYFIGIFLGLTFLMSTGLVIYNKQLSEAYEDVEWIHIYRQVGMTEKEIKASINKQIRTLFLLPPTVTLIHMTVFYKMLSIMLNGFGVLDTAFKVKLFIILFAVYFLFYLIYYRQTSRTYYRIVSPERA